MRITTNEFIKRPALYLEKVSESNVTITKDGQPIAVLTKPNDTPITDSLLGLLKGSGIKSKDEIKAMRTGV
jgi:antitoxin (DNA-binding transcriptional repressor) of toxin-antitoxin stability system